MKHTKIERIAHRLGIDPTVLKAAVMAECPTNASGIYTLCIREPKEERNAIGDP